MSGYETGDGNRLTSDGAYDYTYDNEGNMLTKTRISDGETTEYTWDYRNRLTRIVVKDSQENVVKEGRYTYDVFDRRIGVWEDADGAGSGAAVQRWTVYEGANPWADFDDQGSLTRRYLYGPGIDELWARMGNGEVDWYLTDYLGSVRQLVDADATILDDIDYDSFGQIVNETHPENGDRFTYSSHEFDRLFGQYYYRARYYGADIGRFHSEDPLGFGAGDTNLYRYVFNSPANATDPSGLVSWWNPFTWTQNEFNAWRGGVEDGVLMIYNAATFHQDTQVNNYVNNAVAQNGGGYGFANFSAHVGAYAAEAAIAVWAWGAVGLPTMSVGMQPGIPPHFVFGTGGSWWHAVGGWGSMWVIGADSTAVGSSAILSGIPILFPAAVGTATYGWTCGTAVLAAFWRGWFGR